MSIYGVRVKLLPHDPDSIATLRKNIFENIVGKVEHCGKSRKCCINFLHHQKCLPLFECLIEWCFTLLSTVLWSYHCDAHIIPPLSTVFQSLTLRQLPLFTSFLGFTRTRWGALKCPAQGHSHKKP